MKTKVELAEQPLAYLRGLAPEPRRMIRRALRNLELGRGDIEQLEPPLEDYARLRVRGYRIIVRFEVMRAARVATSVFIERRAVVCELFEAILRGSGFGI